MSSWRRRSRTVGAMAAAMVVGASIPAQATLAVRLNAKSPSPLHAVYVAAISAAIGVALTCLPAVCCDRSACVRPRRCWTLLGGVATAPTVATISASQALGLQLTILLLLVGQLGTALLIDLFGNRRRVGVLTFFGLGFVIIGAIVDGAATANSAIQLKLDKVVHLVLAAVAGSGFALQTFCNRGLADDIGSTLRATCISGVVVQLVLAPIWGALWASGAVTPAVNFYDDWVHWILCGLQFALYVICMPLLSRRLSYTSLFLCTLMGRLVCSTTLDSTGIGHVTVPFAGERAIGILLVVCGVALQLQSEAKPASTPRGQAVGMQVDQTDTRVDRMVDRVVDRAFSK